MPFDRKFTANLSTMFDGDFPERFRRAKQLGFEFVEAQSLYHLDLKSLDAARNETELDVILINSPASLDADLDGEVFGLACIPGNELDFQRSIGKALEIAFALRCKKVHLLAGLKHENFSEENMMCAYKQNMQAAAECLEEHDIIGVIEPICSHVKEGYFMDSFDKAVEVVTEIDSKHLKLLLDVFHLHMLERDVENGIKKYLPHAGHVQISQAPGRQEPFYHGEIDYDKVFKLLAELKYDGHIGLEYTPSDPVEGLTWLENFKVA